MYQYLYKNHTIKQFSVECPLISSQFQLVKEEIYSFKLVCFTYLSNELI